MNLTRLVYYSQRNPSMNVNVDELLAVCRRNNAAMNVTGMLHYNGTNFLQVLEGGRAEVSAIYHRIAADPRHVNIILMACNDVRERIFPSWSMGLHEGMSDETKQIFLRYFPSNKVNPEAISVDSLLDFLQDVSTELT
ncbi:BLUF domain-containing protein [Cognatiyoonia sp. IB215182]|uniref:BLUF domain-containing protein n=1 Tax=Cognatiyoonia sp. IB215182 TaxID=3097353 RepID=UPI002A144295|nr:BLUF domain-containing protein [Cognatiyoonia sp. IB215182]MDX8351825.1 BLUF domain-containing protein [Cognatiyoonia sp. IB215182]